MKFRKKPVEAVQWNKFGDHKKVKKYFALRQESAHPCNLCGNPYNEHGWIDVLRGGYFICPGDWIITESKEEVFPCKPDIFEETYEPVEE